MYVWCLLEKFCVWDQSVKSDNLELQMSNHHHHDHKLYNAYINNNTTLELSDCWKITFHHHHHCMFFRFEILYFFVVGNISQHHHLRFISIALVCYRWPCFLLIVPTPFTVTDNRSMKFEDVSYNYLQKISLRTFQGVFIKNN